jgi:MutS domain V
MTAAEWYTGRAAAWSAARDRENRAATRYSRLRLATFAAAALFAGWGWHDAGDRAATPLFAAAAGFIVVFVFLVRQHARVLERIDRADAGLRLSAIGGARLARDWHALPDVAAPVWLDLDAHPYARDLDLFGHASLTKWLGRTATSAGARLLWSWLLAPAPHAEIPPRQAAVDELAGRRDWREALAIEGALTAVGVDELARFLEWTEARQSAVPRPMRVVAVVLPAALAILLALYVAGVVDGAWWLVPMALNVILSFLFAPAMFATFDRVSIGQRALTRYGTMLDLVCGSTWTAPLLATLRKSMSEGQPAPAAVRRLAALAGWSELRSGAAILHFPIQAMTMWDFHVLFGLERWRRRAGVHVRTWLESLGTADALATLAIARADEPDWVMPDVDPGAGTYAATALAHPLIAADRRVANDVRIGPAGTLLLVTGSNMSGKSTLLRAIGLNAALAQAGGPVCAAALHMPAVELQTSIRVQDSLELGLSYFMAALARLKQIVDAAARHKIGGGHGAPMLMYLLDEVLQGTNSVERGVAVRAVAQHLLDAGAIGAMTTHDLALAGEEPLRSAAALVHFTEQIHAGGSMSFDYHLRPGLATSTNALRLMQAIGIAPR